MHDLSETVPRLRLKAVTLLGRGTLRTADGLAHRDQAAADLGAARKLLEPLMEKCDGQPAVCDLVDIAEAEGGLAALARNRGARDEARSLLEKASAHVKKALEFCPQHAAALRALQRLAAELGSLTRR